MDREPAIVGVAWRYGRWCVGVVLVDAPFEGLRAYIGPAAGDDPAADARDIARWGARLTFREAQAFFPAIDRERWSTR